MFVEVKGNSEKDFQIALAIFKSKVKKEEILEDLRRHEYYVKPSVRRKLKRVEAAKRKRRERNGRKEN